MQQQLTRAAMIIEQVGLQCIPEEVIRIREELQSNHPNTVTIANLIAHNSELLGDFLKLVNSNVTSENCQITNAKAAVNILGLNEISDLFLASSLSNRIAQSSQEKEILKHGAQTGLAAAELSFWVYDVSRTEAYMAGLMQNIGCVYLSRSKPEEYASLFQIHLANPENAMRHEERLFLTNHTFVGALLAKKWRLSSDIYKSILLHHDIEFIQNPTHNQKVRHLIALIMVANFVVESAQGEHYITQEMKQYRDIGGEILNLPENAITAARAAVLKWGNSMGVAPGGH